MNRKLFASLALATALVTACSRRSETTLTSAKVDPPRRGQPSLEALGRAWDRAMAQRDPALLSPLYASNVTFYGVALRHDQVVRVQGDAFTKDQSFTQAIRSMRPTSPTRLELRREWIRFGKKAAGDTWLQGEHLAGGWFIAGEGDAASDARVAARRRGAAEKSFCHVLAEQIALSTPRARALMEGPPDHVTPVFVAGPPQFPGYAIAMTVPAKKGPPTTIDWYDVEPCTLYSPGPNVQASPGVCVPPGAAKGAVTDVFTGHVLSPDLGLLAQMSKCPS